MYGLRKVTQNLVCVSLAAESGLHVQELGWFGGLVAVRFGIVDAMVTSTRVLYGTGHHRSQETWHVCSAPTRTLSMVGVDGCPTEVGRATATLLQSGYFAFALLVGV